MNSLFSHSHINKSAKFLTGIDKYNLINRFNTGLTLDGSYNKISLKRSLQHALVISPSGAGKTTSYVVPNLLRLKNSSAIVLDPSQEIYNLCGTYLSRKFNVKVLNVTDLNISERWNPLEKGIQNPEDIKMISESIITSAYPNSRGSEKFWEDGARSLINVLINGVKNDPKKRNLAYVYQLLNRFNNDQDTINQLLSENLSEENWLEYKGLISQPEKIFGSHVATAKISLSSLSSPVLSELTSKSTIDFSTFRQTPSILFVVVPEHQVKYYSFFLALLYRELFETFMEMPRRGDLPIFMLLDEVGNTLVPGLPGYISTIRKRLVSVSLIIQSTRQLYSLYKDDADVIMENTLNHIYFPGLSLETCQKLSAKIGNKPINQNNYWLPTDKKDFGREPLISAESLRTLKDNRAIYLYGNLPPVMLRLTPWYKSYSLKRRVKKGGRFWVF